MVLTAISILLAAAPALFQMPHPEVDAWLTRLSAEHPDYGARVFAVAEQSLGTPYVDGPLGEGPDGKYDKDPLMDLTRVDCVTFVEQTLALAASTSCEQALSFLQTIRYDHGQIAYEHRNHFMIADWIAHNAFCRDISGALGVLTQTATRTISRKDFFAKRVKFPELGQDIPDQSITLAYVPVAELDQAAKNLPSPALILFIGKVDWLFALHCGLFVRDPAGEGMLIQASSVEKKVIKMPLADAFKNTTRYLGFTAYRIEPPTPIK